ncbi:EDD domain protein, DegV family [Geosporobacter subterraneus DSM 17957]|uniref:EDD domain protein, DegV family n=1 Tax=Geosporobacter subterraneus DSM 17957 TaxID=1121919 RepID=A0A1M6EF34_9FIRM|nr:DegV family protein [Geosporobacter subterraneus]SHI83908.1 EDD domain protein, DegV family [Geosporobacter subterraneus DSM 17957]
MAVKILTDSTSYLKEQIREELDIRMVSLNIAFEDESIREMDIDNDSFYSKMALKGIPTSSQPAVGELYDAMLKVVEKGDDLCCIFLSSEMSGTLATGELVKEMILEKHPEARIEIIDSRSNCMQLGFAVISAARAAKEGKAIEAVNRKGYGLTKKLSFMF